MDLILIALTIVQDFDRAAGRIWQGYDLGDGPFVGCYSAKACRVQTGVDLLDKLQCEERENESFVLKNDDKHVLTQFDSLDHAIESYFSSIFALMVIPNDDFVAGR